jgi:thiol-disulfide isomerase/thioredoxin
MQHPGRPLTLAIVGGTAVLIGAVVAFLALDRYGTAFVADGHDRRPAARDAERSGPAPDAFKLRVLDRAQARPIPDLAFVDGEGHAMSLADFRGRAVLLNIWATWCVPCRTEMPTLDRLQATLGGPDFQVVALSIDRQGDAVIKPFYQQLGLKSLGVYVDQSGKAAGDLHSPGVPITLLIDRTGREIARKLGPADWDSPEMIGLIREHLGPHASGRKATR